MESKLMDFNLVTRYIKIAFDILFVKDPVATSIGVLVGSVLHLLLNIAALFTEPQLAESLRNINMFYFIAAGILTCNWRNFQNRPKISDKAEHAIALLKQGIEEGLITKTDAKLQYKRIVIDEIDQLLESRVEVEEKD